MKSPSEQQARVEVIDAFAEMFGCPAQAIRLSVPASVPYDYRVSVPGHRFCVEYKNRASAAALSNALTQLKQAALAHAGHGLPLLVVPYQGPLGKKLCEQYGIGWFDLCGNADILGPGLRIRVQGFPNKFRERGRPSNAFAARSSRVVRQLLAEPRRFQAQAEIARQTGLGDGYVSKIVRRLAQEEYLESNKLGAVRASDPDLLLDAWRSAYDFARHRILAGYVAADSGDSLVRKVAMQLSQATITYAVSGPSAARLYLKVDAFGLTTFYLRSSMPSRSFLQKLKFEDEPKSGNLWLVVPDDDGVFHQNKQQDGVDCVSPLQAYLDLKGQPAPANDAAAELRRKFLNWRQRGT
jgi:hypothetical protein